ncbi:cytochrome P460 family protein [Oscillatoria sp. CS-180]|uniref:cytochrome P460 family protein n=1 Tax=Oscillatoria sp. CS-180 TaxID=3021720 RepID=UPI00232CD5FF|nr:cytochrome P460 family protein [Oscillatoria sp. CS-180]MDB9524779.1 cytochrome P460 family protein [Oscillatoria sp. CS-180]
MNRPKWLTWLLLFSVAIAAAITLTHFTPHRALYSSDTRDRQPASASDAASNLHPDLYADAAYDEMPENAETSLRVRFPANYREQFVQYVTVDCPNSRIVRQMFVNPEALSALQTSDTPPSGTVLVMETHSAQPGSDGRLMPTRLNNVFVREKRDGWRVNEDSGEWRSAWYSPQGSLVSNNQSSCTGCHTMVRERDYLFTLPALLATAQTGQKQYQPTEFGTSVCR